MSHNSSLSGASYEKRESRRGAERNRASLGHRMRCAPFRTTRRSQRATHIGSRASSVTQYVLPTGITRMRTGGELPNDLCQRPVFVSRGRRHHLSAAAASRSVPLHPDRHEHEERPHGSARGTKRREKPTRVSALWQGRIQGVDTCKPGPSTRLTRSCEPSSREQGAANQTCFRGQEAPGTTLSACPNSDRHVLRPPSPADAPVQQLLPVYGLLPG
jgi:hypothetical protein